MVNNDVCVCVLVRVCVCVCVCVCVPRPEAALLEDGTTVKRPVIRLFDGLVVLTRIDPTEKKTSMLFRVRPGWEELRKFLAGELDGKQRYVCTHT